MRDDFTIKTKETIAGRVGWKCSKPCCQKLCIGPRSSPNKTCITGEAAHITAASENGPRFDKNLTREERRSLENGIWLCSEHAGIIDTDVKAYPVDLLHEWKSRAERRAELEQQGIHIVGNPFLYNDLKEIYLDDSVNIFISLCVDNDIYSKSVECVMGQFKGIGKSFSIVLNNAGYNFEMSNKKNMIDIYMIIFHATELLKSVKEEYEIVKRMDIPHKYCLVHDSTPVNQIFIEKNFKNEITLERIMIQSILESLIKSVKNDKKNCELSCTNYSSSKSFSISDMEFLAKIALGYGLIKLASEVLNILRNAFFTERGLAKLYYEGELVFCSVHSFNLKSECYINMKLSSGFIIFKNAWVSLVKGNDEMKPTEELKNFSQKMVMEWMKTHYLFESHSFQVRFCE